MPSKSILHWATEAFGSGVKNITVESLNDRRSNPWRLRIEDGDGIRELVLRTPVPGAIDKSMIATNVAALQIAERHGLAAPRLVAADLDGKATGTAATLETVLPGSSALPPRASAERLRAAGAAIAKVHTVPLMPQRNLPRRIRPIQVDDRAMERRWVTLYQASSDNEKLAVIEALCKLLGCSAEDARDIVSGGRLTPLLHLADERIRALPIPQGQMVFVHGDIWGGNMLWDGDICLALIDWKTAGAGDPGVDLGELRMQMALQYGQGAPAHVLEGWQHESGREATHMAYWDVVAALNTPTKLHGWPGFDDEGHPLDEPAVTKRRDMFLANALDSLDREEARLEHHNRVFVPT
jgi:aminoglycoside phosphotransferase (APT) family kinase protein